MSYIKRFLDEVNEHFIANASRVELHWMEQEYEKHKQEQHEEINQEDIQEIEVIAEVITGKEDKATSTSEVGGSRHNSLEVLHNKPISEIRSQRDIGEGVLPKSEEQGDTSS